MLKVLRRPVALVMTLFCVACNADSIATLPMKGNADNQQPLDIHARYKAAVRVWKQYLDQPQTREMSNTSYFVDNSEYRSIISLGSDVVPFLVEDIAAGEFYLNYALEAITRIDVAKRYPDEQIRGEQDRCRLWIRWWNEEGQHQYQRLQ